METQFEKNLNLNDKTVSQDIKVYLKTIFLPEYIARFIYHASEVRDHFGLKTLNDKVAEYVLTSSFLFQNKDFDLTKHVLQKYSPESKSLIYYDENYIFEENDEADEQKNESQEIDTNFINDFLIKNSFLFNKKDIVDIYYDIESQLFDCKTFIGHDTLNLLHECIEIDIAYTIHVINKNDLPNNKDSFVEVLHLIGCGITN